MPPIMQPALSESECVWEFFGRRTDGFFVEVGANDPHAGSQTWSLESKGWRGILVEPLERFQTVLKAARPRSQVFRAACGPPGHPATAEFFEAEASAHSGLRPHAVDAATQYVSRETVRVLTLDELLAEAGHPRVDFISIDTEGTQLDVLRGLDLQRHAPKLLLVEDHLYDFETHFHLRRKRYRLVKRTHLNNWYIPERNPFRLSTPWERLRLWRKLWPGTPLRMVKFRRERRALRAAAF
jgi:FkbM family methyltransferase